MITHTTEPDGTLVIRVSMNARRDHIRHAAEIADKAASHFGLPISDLLGTSREWPLVDCRQMAIRLMRERGVSSLAVAQLFRRDAKSANYALRACLAKISVEPAFARRYEALRAAVLADGKEARSA